MDWLRSQKGSNASRRKLCRRRRVLAPVMTFFTALVMIACQPGPLASDRPVSPGAVRSATQGQVPGDQTAQNRQRAQGGKTAQPKEVDARSVATPIALPADAAWAESVGLGPDAPTPENWNRIQAQASAEGYVLLYSDTSRSLNAIESLSQAHPGLEAEAITLGSQDIYLRLVDDVQRGNHAADVYLVSDPPRTLELLAQYHLWNYVPADLIDALPETMRAPLLVHHWSALTLIYNPTLAEAPPIDNWWDLTQPEWQGRVALPDPTVDERTMYLLTTLVQHSDKVAAAYRAKFGHQLVPDVDCPNAGYQWIKGLLANQPILLHSDAEVADLVGGTEADEIRIGLCGYEQYEKVSRGQLSFAPILEAMPTAGLQWPTYLALVNRCQRPNAAKLLVRWLMGDETGEEGYSAWRYPGFYPSRTDVPDPKGVIPREEMAARLWQPDAVYIDENLVAMRDFIAAHLGRR